MAYLEDSDTTKRTRYLLLLAPRYLWILIRNPSIIPMGFQTQGIADNHPSAKCTMSKKKRSKNSWSLNLHDF